MQIRRSASFRVLVMLHRFNFLQVDGRVLRENLHIVQNSGKMLGIDEAPWSAEFLRSQVRIYLESHFANPPPIGAVLKVPLKCGMKDDTDVDDGSFIHTHTHRHRGCYLQWFIIVEMRQANAYGHGAVLAGATGRVGLGPVRSVLDRSMHRGRVLASAKIDALFVSEAETGPGLPGPEFLWIFCIMMHVECTYCFVEFSSWFYTLESILLWFLVRMLEVIHYTECSRICIVVYCWVTTIRFSLLTSMISVNCDYIVLVPLPSVISQVDSPHGARSLELRGASPEKVVNMIDLMSWHFLNPSVMRYQCLCLCCCCIGHQGGA